MLKAVASGSLEPGDGQVYIWCEILYSWSCFLFSLSCFTYLCSWLEVQEGAYINHISSMKHKSWKKIYFCGVVSFFGEMLRYLISSQAGMHQVDPVWVQSSSPGWSNHGCPASYHGGLQPQWMCYLLYVLPMMGPNVHQPCLEPFFMTFSVQTASPLPP